MLNSLFAQTMLIPPHKLRNVKNILTVRELRDLLEGYEDDTPIVTYDELNHGRGACWGYVADVEESVEDKDEDE